MMPTGEGAHKVKNTTRQDSLDDQGETESVTVVSDFPALLILK
jgi:hypothetical protein